MAQTTSKPRHIPEAAIEALGTFLLVLIGTSALTAINIAGQATTPLVILVTSVAFSLPIIWLIGHFSLHRLGQFNPAITLLLLLNQRIGLIQAIINMLSQSAAALIASIAVGLLYGSPGVEIGLGSPQPLTSMGEVAALSGEVLGSLIIFITILYQLKTNQSFKQMALPIGLSVAIASLMATGISGASFNPVRAMAPQLASDSLNGLWLYLAAPFAAAILATIMDKAARVQILSQLAGQEAETQPDPAIPLSQPMHQAEQITRHTPEYAPEDQDQQVEVYAEQPEVVEPKQSSTEPNDSSAQPPASDATEQATIQESTESPSSDSLLNPAPAPRPKLSFSNFNINDAGHQAESAQDETPSQPHIAPTKASPQPQPTIDKTEINPNNPTIIEPKPPGHREPATTSRTKLSFVDYDESEL